VIPFKNEKQNTIAMAQKQEKKRAAASGYGKSGTRTAAQTAEARTETRNELNKMEATHVRIFTDGSCRRNPGPAGSGAALFAPTVADTSPATLTAKRALGSKSTNNIAELEAIGIGLDLLANHLESSSSSAAAAAKSMCRVVILTDSKYVLGVLTLGWTPTCNRLIIRSLQDRIKEWTAQLLSFNIKWVPGHVGLAGNTLVDRLANEACQDSADAAICAHSTVSSSSSSPSSVKSTTTRC
jgi:ribonuclease HI